MHLRDGGDWRVRVVLLPHNDVFEIKGQTERMQVEASNVNGIGRKALVQLTFRIGSQRLIKERDDNHDQKEQYQWHTDEPQPQTAMRVRCTVHCHREGRALFCSRPRTYPAHDAMSSTTDGWDPVWCRALSAMASRCGDNMGPVFAENTCALIHWASSFRV